MDLDFTNLWLLQHSCLNEKFGYSTRWKENTGCEIEFSALKVLPYWISSESVTW
jgi:hypothetical protein